MAAKKTASVRKDPVQRPVNAADPYFSLENARPDREYRWIYKAAPEMGVSYYRAMGWRVVQYVEGGPQAIASEEFEHGAVVESRGHVLMEMSKADAQAAYEAGQAQADIMERKMRNSPQAIKDLTRRIAMRSPEGSEYFAMEAERGSVALAGEMGAD